MMVARTRKAAHCLLDRNQRWRFFIRNSTPCSLRLMG